MEIKLTLLPLTAEAFAPFGDVIELSTNNNIIPINYGLTKRHHALAEVEISASNKDISADGKLTMNNDAKAIISLFDCTPITLPFQIKVMERHPLGSQAFLPMHQQDYIVVVANAGEFDQNTLHAFKVRADQGVNFHQGTWHHYCLILNENLVLNEGLSLHTQCTFAVVDRSGTGNNCDEVIIEHDTTITIMN